METMKFELSSICNSGKLSISSCHKKAATNVDYIFATKEIGVLWILSFPTILEVKGGELGELS